MDRLMRDLIVRDLIAATAPTKPDIWPQANKPYPFGGLPGQTRERAQTAQPVASKFMENEAEITWGDVAKAAQRLVNAATALQTKESNNDFGSEGEAAAFDEYADAQEAVVLLCLRKGCEDQRLVSLALDECAKAVRDFS